MGGINFATEREFGVSTEILYLFSMTYMIVVVGLVHSIQQFKFVEGGGYSSQPCLCLNMD